MKSSQSRNGRQFWAARAGTGVLAAAVIGTVLLFVASSAASPLTAKAASFSEKPPYAGTSNSNEFGQLSGSGGPLCGVTQKFPTTPFFNLTTGHANVSANATSRSCGPGTSFASPEESAGVATANFTTTSGLHHIKATWILDFSVKLRATPGSASQSALAYILITLQLYLFDATNFTVVTQNNSPYLDYSISSGTFDHNFNKITETLFLNATLVSGHEYSLATNVYLNAYAGASPGHSSAFATGNMGSGGRSAYLSSLSGL